MATLAQTLSQTLTQNLLNSLPAAVATKFELDEAAVKATVTEYLTAQLGAAAVGKAKKPRSPSPKGTDGKGRTSGFMLFMAANRKGVIEAATAAGEVFPKKVNTKTKGADGKTIWGDDVLDANGAPVMYATIPQHIVASRIGTMWQALSDAEKGVWNAGAVAQNTANGLPPAEKRSPKAAAAPKVAAVPKVAGVAPMASFHKAAAPKVAAAVKATCPVILTRGARKDQACGANAKSGETFCSKHATSAAAAASTSE